MTRVVGRTVNSVVTTASGTAARMLGKTCGETGTGWVGEVSRSGGFSGAEVTELGGDVERTGGTVFGAGA